jgi:hypothetical protein
MKVWGADEASSRYAKPFWVCMRNRHEYTDNGSFISPGRKLIKSEEYNAIDQNE